MAREKQVDNAVLKVLNERGVWCYKNYSDLRNPSGVPDIVGCYNGMPLFIEDKKPKGEKSDVSFLQKKHLQHITQQGGVGVIAKSASFVEDVLNAIDSDDRETELRKLGWKTHGNDDIRNDTWNKETIW